MATIRSYRPLRVSPTCSVMKYGSFRRRGAGEAFIGIHMESREMLLVT